MSVTLKQSLSKLDDELYKPSYEKYSLVNIGNAILNIFQCETHHNPYPLNEEVSGITSGVDRVVLFLIDALGDISLQELEQKNRDLTADFVRLKATSVFPTTTSTSLASLCSALMPIEHGIVGYTFFMKQFGSLVNMIELSTFPFGREHSIERSLPVKRAFHIRTIFEILKEEGIKPFVITAKNIRNSGFSNLINNGAFVKSYNSFGDMFSKTKDVVSEKVRSFTFVYWGLLDSIGHKYGVDSDAFKTEMFWLLNMIKREILPILDNKTLFLVIGDHGQIATPWEKETWWSERDKIFSLLSFPPGGEMRMMHLYTKKLHETIEYLREHFSERCLVLTRSDAFEKKLFGDGIENPEVRDRIGDVVLIAKSNYSFYFKITGREESLKSKHGSLTPNELIVPLLAWRR